MKEIKFDDLAQFLKTGREIEFAYNGKHYSITNNPTGYWYFCLDEDTSSIILEKVCPFKELDYLAQRTADITIDGITIRQIFDELLYDASLLDII